MGTGVRRFEDLVAWQKSRDLVHNIYAVTSTANFSRNYELKDQIRRTAVSVMSNIAEGSEWQLLFWIWFWVNGRRTASIYK